MTSAGSYRALITDDFGALTQRKQGFILRDTLYILGPSTQVRLGLLFQERLSEPSITRQVLATGKGVLNIDACRIAADMSEFYSKTTGKPRSGMGHAHGYGMGAGYGGDRANPPHKLGRWPGNLVFVHGPECIRLEKSLNWECVPDCPVFALDSQAGNRKSGAFDQASRSAGNSVYNNTFHGYTNPKVYEASEGGASRFYPQFASDEDLHAWIARLTCSV